MTRSRKKMSISGIAKAKSTRGYKKRRAGQERAKQKALLYLILKRNGLDDEIVATIDLVKWDEWACERDGKRYFDKKKYPKLMRK